MGKLQDMAHTARTFKLEREVPLRREEVWELLANTDHLNRAIGLSVATFDPLPDDSTAVHREARTKLAGIPLRYREYPFNWIKYREYAVRRVYQGGPLAEFVGGIRLRDGDDSNSTHLEVFADLTAANAFGALLLPALARRSLRQLLDYCNRYIEMRRDNPSFTLPPAPTRPSVEVIELETALARLKKQPLDARLDALDGRAIEKLDEWIRTRGDDEVASMRPYQLAREWDVAPDAALRVFLYATRVGLLNLQWNLLCPNCRVSKAAADSLADVNPEFHCDMCGVTYGANFDRYVELRFTPHPNIRAAYGGAYCIGGPHISPHVLVQQMVPGNSKVLMPFPDSHEPLRLRVLRSNHTLNFGDEGDVQRELFYSENGWSQKIVPSLPVGEPLSIVNSAPHDILVALEKSQWNEDAVTAYKVTTMPEFRTLFGSEVLAPGAHVGIENLTLFFSDLKDSTTMYERDGDSPAYGAVRRHFDYLFEHIEANSGSVVKTIGDAVMAVFYSPENALRAAIAMQQNIDEFNDSIAAPPSSNRETADATRAIVLKIGIHFGPAIAVNSNDRLDYFGRTVNIAARIQGASVGRDMVLSSAVFDRPGVQQILQDNPIPIRKFEANLKGIDGVFSLYQVQV